MRTTLLGAGTLLFCLSIASASAQSIESWDPEEAHTTTEMNEYATSLLTANRCVNAESAQKNRCVSDMLNDIKRLRQDYLDAEEIEIAAWHLEHDPAGLSAENVRAARAYHAEMHTRKKAFFDILRQISKQTFDVHHTVRGSKGPPPTRGYSRSIGTGDLAAAKAACKKQDDTTALRICMRQQLRTTDPNARRMGAAARRERGM